MIMEEMYTAHKVTRNNEKSNTYLVVFLWSFVPQHFKMIRYIPFFFVFVLSSNAQNCGDFTTKDVEGPFFVEGVPLDLSTATDDEVRDPSLATILQGKVMDRNCRAVTGATVDVWYAGGGSGSGYTESLN